MNPTEIQAAALAFQSAVAAGVLVGVKLFGAVFAIRVLLSLIRDGGKRDA